MAIQEFFTSRNNGIPSGIDYVGQCGRLWYDPGSNSIRVYNSLPGGQVVSGGSSGSANIAVYNQSIPVTNTVVSFNFIGSGVVTTAVGDAVTVDIPGAGYISFDGGSPSNFYVNGPAFDCGGVY